MPYCSVLKHFKAGSFVNDYSGAFSTWHWLYSAQCAQFEEFWTDISCPSVVNFFAYVFLNLTFLLILGKIKTLLLEIASFGTSLI